MTRASRRMLRGLPPEAKAKEIKDGCERRARRKSLEAVEMDDDSTVLDKAARLIRAVGYS